MAATEHNRLMLRALVKVALPAIESAPIAERADAFEGIAIACAGVDDEIARTAGDAANSIREAMSNQLLFRQLLS